MSYILCLPFIGLILSMALLPTLKPRFWHRYDKAICLWWAAFVIVMILYFNGQSFVFSKVSHALFHHYIPFISIVSSLYLIGAGIRVELAGTPSPLKNSFFLMIGGLLSNIIGTTGASMLLIRPFLGFNRHRRQQTHLVIFFIFTVANIGGVLLPLGDPPLFLGFLEGVPFFGHFNICGRPLYAFSLARSFSFTLWIDIFFLKKKDIA